VAIRSAALQMRGLACAAVQHVVILTVLAVVVKFAAAAMPPRHNCIHDHDEVQVLVRGSLESNPRVQRRRVAETRKFDAAVDGSAAPHPIRFSISSMDLDNAAQYCSTAGVQRPDFRGSHVTCTDEDVLTPAKKAVLLDKILPLATARLAELLSLTDSSDEAIVVPQGTCGAEFTVPSAHSAEGVHGTDYVLYVAAGPTPDGTLAWAGACAADAAGRFIVGRANFGARYIQWSDSDDSVNAEQVQTAVHELIHALGVSSSAFNASLVKTVTKRGKQVTLLTGVPTAIAQLRSFLGCQTVEGIELEDEGAEGSLGSHWERRIVPDELMTATSGFAVSGVTLGVLRDLAGYTVNMDMANQMSFGRAAGCGYVNSKCNETAGGAGKWWCFDTDRGVSTCTADLKAVGFCGVALRSDPLPTQFQYFADSRLGGQIFADGCPYISAYSNSICSAYRPQTSNDVVLGESYGASSRCFKALNLLMDGYESSDAGGTRCLLTRCESTTGRLQVRVGNGAYKTCDYEGAVLSGFVGYAGSVLCPPSLAVCAAATVTPGTGPVTTSTSSPAPPSIYSSSSVAVEGTVTLSGAAYSLLDLRQLDAMSQPLVADLARALSIAANALSVGVQSASSADATFSFAVLTYSLTRAQVRTALKQLVDTGGAVPSVSLSYNELQPIDETRMVGFSVVDPQIPLCSDPGNIPADMCLVYAGIGVACGLIVCCLAFVAYACYRRHRASKIAEAEPNMVMVGPSDMDIRHRKVRVRKL
jgi:leishmanolysin